MSLFCQHFNPELPDGRSWDAVRDEVADLIIDTVNEYAPNFKASVLGRQVLSPLDLEREFGLLGGDIFHGALHLDQIYSLRPAAGYSDHRSPVEGLYLCGSWKTCRKAPFAGLERREAGGLRDRQLNFADGKRRRTGNLPRP